MKNCIYLSSIPITEEQKNEIRNVYKLNLILSEEIDKLNSVYPLSYKEFSDWIDSVCSISNKLNTCFFFGDFSPFFYEMMRKLHWRIVIFPSIRKQDGTHTRFFEFVYDSDYTLPDEMCWEK